VAQRAAGGPPQAEPAAGAGPAASLWLAFVIILPFLGVFVYLIARGHKMAERDVAQAQAQDQAFRAYVQEAAHQASTADELAKLVGLRDHGVITEADFQQGQGEDPQGSGLTF
jgi:hypothetical protein